MYLLCTQTPSAVTSVRREVRGVDLTFAAAHTGMVRTETVEISRLEDPLGIISQTTSVRIVVV